MIAQLLSFALIGVIAGMGSGLFGIGGGIVTVPSLLFAFSYFGIPSSSPMQLAIGTSFAAMTFNTFSAAYAHYKKKGILFAVVKPMAVGVLLGVLFGATVSRFLSSDFLQKFFAVFEILFGVYFCFPPPKIKKERFLPSFFPLVGISTAVSILSALLGIGGGLINVPILSHYSVPMKKAIGTASTLSFLVSFCGALSYLVLHSSSHEAPYTISSLYLPAFLTISMASFMVAPYGAHLAHSLPTHILKRLFGLLLIAAGCLMLFK